MCAFKWDQKLFNLEHDFEHRNSHKASLEFWDVFACDCTGRLKQQMTSCSGNSCKNSPWQELPRESPGCVFHQPWNNFYIKDDRNDDNKQTVGWTKNEIYWILFTRLSPGQRFSLNRTVLYSLYWVQAVCIDEQHCTMYTVERFLQRLNCTLVDTVPVLKYGKRRFKPVLRIRDVFPDFVSRIRIFSIPDPESRIRIKNLSILTPKNGF